MTEPQKNLVKQWILKAENDLLNVANNLQKDLRFTRLRTKKRGCDQLDRNLFSFFGKLSVSLP